MKSIPTFDVKFNINRTDFDIIDQESFHTHVLEFIKEKIETGETEENLLCLFAVKNGSGEILEAKLDKYGYKKSLRKCLSHFTMYEEYEKCASIIKILEQIKDTHEI